jgi:PPOX class probable F420-dependent enzyme
MAELPEWGWKMCAEARTGHLATASPAGEPHVVVVCFVVVGGCIVSPIDEKPKSGRILTRVRNIRSNPRAAFSVDSWDEDWTQLAWVQARGSASVITPPSPLHQAAVDALRWKYPQYRLMALEQAEMIVLAVERWSWWRASAD